MSFIDFLFLLCALGLAIITLCVMVEAWKIAQAERDYPEDLELASCSQNLCTECSNWFTGCYSRVICKRCSEHIDYDDLPNMGEENGH